MSKTTILIEYDEYDTVAQKKVWQAMEHLGTESYVIHDGEKQIHYIGTGDGVEDV